MEQTFFGKKSEHYSITPQQYQIGLAKIDEQITALGLDVESPQVQIVGRVKKTNTAGNDSAEKTSIDRYACIWKGLLNFCIEIGDYKSGIILARDQCPINPLPVSLETAIAYLRFRCLIGKPLVHQANQEPVISKFTNTQMVGHGGWTSVSGVKMYGTALWKLHSHYSTTDMDYYQAECPLCILVPLADIRRGTGCVQHGGKPEYFRRGCCTKQVAFKNNLAQMVTFVESLNLERHSIAFLPKEIRAMRRYLLCQNSVYHLMIWTIMIVGVKEALCIEEDLNIEIEHFSEAEPYYQFNEDGRVQSLAFKVRGKTDSDWVFFKMWADD